MTLLERKAEFIKTVLTDIDENTFEELEFIFGNMRPKSGKTKPCIYSHEEVNRRVDEALLSVESGHYFTHEEVNRRVEKG